jgi:hypothetical protein
MQIASATSNTSEERREAARASGSSLARRGAARSVTRATFIVRQRRGSTGCGPHLLGGIRLLHPEYARALDLRIA